MEIPILFSTQMVQAILAGRKTQTRRIIKPQPVASLFSAIIGGCDNIPFMARFWEKREPNNPLIEDVKLKYNIGDILWVKEMHYAYGRWIEYGYTKTCKPKRIFLDSTQSYVDSYRYFDMDGYRYFDNPPENVLPNSKLKTYGWFKRNSLFMPKKACRIKLLLKNVSVERVQDITEEDVKEEGVQIPVNNGAICWVVSEKDSAITFMPPADEHWSQEQVFKAHYAELWCKINGRESWNNNPFVWKIEFELINNQQL